MATQNLFSMFGATPEEVRAKYEAGLMMSPELRAQMTPRARAISAISGGGRNIGYSLGRMLGGRVPGEEKAMLIQEAIAEANSRNFAVPEKRYTALAEALLSRGLEAEGMQAIDAARQARLNEAEETFKRDERKAKLEEMAADTAAARALAEQRKKVKDAKTISERNRNFITELEVKLRDGGELTTAELVQANVWNEQERRDKTYIDKDTREEVTIVGFDINSAAPMLAAALKQKFIQKGSATNGKTKEGAPSSAQNGRRTETRETPESLKIKQGFRTKLQDGYDKLALEMQAMARAWSAITPTATGWGWVVFNPKTGLLGFAPKTDARSLSNYLDPIATAKLLKTLQELKSQSATGASGLGQITEKEIDILLKDLTALDPADDNFRSQLKLVYSRYVKLMDNIERDMRELHGGKLVKTAIPALDSVKKRSPTVPEKEPVGTASGVVQDLTQQPRFIIEDDE